MAKPIQFSIADPCHENWDNMTSAEQGRFCSSCQKQVVDFSGMSDAQVLAFFKKPTAGTVCGRFYQDQLERDMFVPKKQIPWMKYFFQFALPAFLASAKASAQGNIVIKKQDITTIAPQEMRMKLGEVSVPQKAVDIKGKVTNNNHAPVPYASIVIKGSKRTVMADSNGVFRISNIMQDDFTLQVSCAGFQPAETAVTKKTDLTKDVVVQLDGKVLEEVVVVSYPMIIKGQIMMGAISRVVKKAADTSFVLPVIEPPAEKPAMIKVYPNPVMAGTSINIGCEKLEEGYYSLQLFNQAGQAVQHKQIWIDAEAGIINTEIPSVTAGTYILTLVNKETRKRFSEKILIQ